LQGEPALKGLDSRNTGSVGWNGQDRAIRTSVDPPPSSNRRGYPPPTAAKPALRFSCPRWR